MEELFPIITSKKNLHSILYFVSEEVCRFLSKPWPVKLSPLRSNHLTLLRTSRPKFKIRKAFLQISNVSSLLENNWKMEEHFPIITSKRNQLFILYFVSEEVCKFLSKPWLEKLSPLRLSHLTPLKTSRPKSKTRKEFLQISNVLSLLESN